MSDKQSLIDWKTDAWKDPDMVAWYSKRMVENTGSNQLKHRLEMDYIARYATGHKVLDVGIGTGRASIPLAQKGMDVTGVDSSQAMLDETRRLAGDTPMTLLPGDVANLPLPSHSYDFLVSLNVVVHFPHWQEILVEWDRVLRPGGRILFDIHSLDHLEAVYGAGEPAEQIAKTGEQAGAYGHYMSLTRAREIVQWADQHGYTVTAITAVGGFVASTRNHFLTNLENKHWWHRLLGWLASDAKMFEFALWLEENIVWNLPSMASGRFMVVLDKQPNPLVNAAWLAEDARRRQAWAEGRIEDALGFSPQQVIESIEGLATHPRNTYLVYEILQAITQHHPELAWEDYLPQELRALFGDWALQTQLDAFGLKVACDWRRGGNFGAKFASREVPLGPGLEYNLMRDVLTHYMNIFQRGGE